ncbi:hypothetical protein HGRIS_006784 [Hohenbuehelia grisea]|uniref:Glutaminase A N-terminal domain-containing protein n=1 Tax=Hohenbuehelia grisea TaxID=104357 RepID=A0ABR3JAQ3_9AGAR
MVPQSIFASLMFLPNVAFAQIPQTFWPASVPLVLKSPYLQAWLPTWHTINPPAVTAPRFWTAEKVLGWGGYMRIDDVNYQWLGTNGPGNKTSLMNTIITPTQSIFTIQAGPLEVNITFLSPIEPHDLVLQSFPFAYYFIEFAATDGQAHKVQLYSDIAGGWVSENDASLLLQWNTTQTLEAVYHCISRKDKADRTLQEVNDGAEDGAVYFGMAMRPGLTWQTGSDSAVRTQFNNSGTLTGLQTGTTDKDRPVLAISVDLGSVESTSEPVLWAIGLV